MKKTSSLIEKRIGFVVGIFFHLLSIFPSEVRIYQRLDAFMVVSRSNYEHWKMRVRVFMKFNLCCFVHHRLVLLWEQFLIASKLATGLLASKRYYVGQTTDCGYSMYQVIVQWMNGSIVIHHENMWFLCTLSNMTITYRCSLKRFRNDSCKFHDGVLSFWCSQVLGGA